MRSTFPVDQPSVLVIPWSWIVSPSPARAAEVTLNSSSSNQKAWQLRQPSSSSGFPFTSREYADPASVDYSRVEVPNALWHQDHTFTCFAFPTFTEADCQQIGQALVKVVKAYS